jgi:hypothetical protein
MHFRCGNRLRGVGIGKATRLSVVAQFPGAPAFTPRPAPPHSCVSLSHSAETGDPFQPLERHRVPLARGTGLAAHQCDISAPLCRYLHPRCLADRRVCPLPHDICWPERRFLPPDCNDAAAALLLALASAKPKRIAGFVFTCVLEDGQCGACHRSPWSAAGPAAASSEPRSHSQCKPDNHHDAERHNTYDCCWFHWASV